MPQDPLLFEFDLPRDLIAQQPLRNRADARLMVIDRQKQAVSHHHVRDLPELLVPGDRMVLNDTRVVPAQLAGRRAATGGRWQGLYLGSTEEGHWRVVCKTRGRLEPGESVVLDDREGRPSSKLWLLERLEAGQWLAHLQPEEPTEEALTRLGRVPLPHYIRGGQMVDEDVTRYQTVFAKRPGAVAAPTAGLHFTKELLKSTASRGVEFSALTLHVGLGTFRPISGGSIEEHQMHSEWCELSAAAAAEINATRESGGRVISVGTTAVRTLETAAGHSPEGGPLQPWSGETDLFIRPPYQFRAVDALLTNFHFPSTTLLVLVQTFGGPELIRAAYHEAIAERYRFYSYGDAMLIL
ncbi:S-adenosylmethionine:tRNA ribosyltransferase-isomerase [Posidoniimonas polymericola]|uniref:S-adenosylmethionine:tRNA ribosyltransferase-isomerase n=1 Tax=Posidoniimonas polymericola TaxID=2528002 RepID=A0A5C5YPF1_9BACT|nr:tRNA preQ1(34) S-adenosylmethionine ribosyltransferase-isomerase QueA [Posidoniimonas polymericola]TWT76842.1 S-adenosylmethionine:tRNA ribosyltransferase-isomerase [Posidoniimonas polymericola]